MSKADHDWTITISGRGPCKRGIRKDPDQVMLEVAERLEKSGQSIEITDFEAVPLESSQFPVPSSEEPQAEGGDQTQNTKHQTPKRRKRK